MSKTVTDVDGKLAVIDGTTQPPLITAPPRSLEECMKRLAVTQQRVIEEKDSVKLANGELKAARQDLELAVEHAIEAFEREGPGGQLSLDAAERIRRAAHHTDGDE